MSPGAFPEAPKTKRQRGTPKGVPRRFLKKSAIGGLFRQNTFPLRLRRGRGNAPGRWIRNSLRRGRREASAQWAVATEGGKATRRSQPKRAVGAASARRDD